MFPNILVNEYVWSAFVTFIAAFGAAVLPFAGSLPADRSALFAIIAVGIRAGVAAFLNLSYSGLFSKNVSASSKPQ